MQIYWHPSCNKCHFCLERGIYIYIAREIIGLSYGQTKRFCVMKPDPFNNTRKSNVVFFTACPVPHITCCLREKSSAFPKR